MSRTKAAVAVFQTDAVKGEAVAQATQNGIRLSVKFTELPPGKHGFHIHKAGDLRGEGCKGACDHYHVGKPCRHGPAPASKKAKTRKQQKQRHTGDLGNIAIRKGAKQTRRSYNLSGVRVEDLWGRSLIVHADEDDLGRGNFPDSGTTGHSGARIACAIFGRAVC